MAVVDVSQFLWKKFLRSMVDAESELSGSMDLLSYFEEVKHILVNTQKIPFSLETVMPWNASWEMNTYIRANGYLSELNYALAECQTFANECRELKKNVLLFNPSTIYFILKMKKRLAILKRKFVALVVNNPSIPISTLREYKETTVECLGFTEKDIIVIKKSSEEIVVQSDSSFGTFLGPGMVENLLIPVGNPTGVGFTAIGIIGMAGVGKTTLIKGILERPSVLSEFCPIIQLCLTNVPKGNQVVDASMNGVSISISIVNLILEKLGAGGSSGLGLNLLLERLHSLLFGKKYLIAFDDVWNIMEFYSNIGYQLPEGEKFGDRLSHGLPKDSGGAVIVVSRIAEVVLDVVGLRQNSLNKRLTTLKRKLAPSTLVERQGYESSKGPSVSTGEQEESKAKEIVAVKKSSKDIFVLPDVNEGRFRSEGKIQHLLLSGAAAEIGFMAIGIVGIGGMGKSAFIHDVLRLVWSEFDPIVWLCFSDIIKEKGKQQEVEADTSEVISICIVVCILEKLGHDIDKEDIDLGELLKRLHGHLSDKRYLIVLDDVWDIMEFYSNLCYILPEGEKFGDRLSHGLPKGSGGAVIVTSRIIEVAQDMVGMGQNNLFLVPPLDREWCLMQFKSFISMKADRCGKEKRFSMSNWEVVQQIEHEILDQISGLPSIAKALAELIVDKQISETEDNGSSLKEMLIPREFLIHRSFIFVPINERKVKWVDDAIDIPKCPVFVFVDLKMEHFAVRLLEEFRCDLNREQVIAVLDESFINRQKTKTEEPDKVLKEFYGILEKLKCEGHPFADQVQKKMTIIIVGGDVFANWFLGVICDLKLPNSPSIVPIALGIKANLASSFGWEFDADKVAVNKILGTVLNHAKQIKTDSWHILIKMKVISTAHQEIPYCLHKFHPVHEADMENADYPTLIYGGFWNYFSLGVDDPRLYGASRFRHTSRTLTASLAKVEILKNHGDKWEMLSIPSRIRSIVCLNLPGFPGGLTPWTTANMKKDPSRGLTSSFVDDGHLEIIGSNDDLLSLKKRWICLDQVREIRFKFIEDSAEVVNMMFDGVPWKRSPLDGLVEVQITYHSQVNILVKQDYLAKSINDSSQPRGSEISLLTDNDEANTQGQRKFGAASSFIIPVDPGDSC